MHSAIYRGWLRHRRHTPRPHDFRYPLFMVYLDLAELATVFDKRWFWSTRRPALARFERADHFGDPSIPLERAVRDLVEIETERRPDGPIRLLTHLRYFGYCFNPVSFYYCFDATDTQVETVVAEVTNTPWGERHCYVLGSPDRPATAGYQRYRQTKRMHVSPFMPMDIEYAWGLSQPGESLHVHMALHGPAKIFDASLRLRRSALSARALAACLIAFPLMTLQIIAAIHWQALRLWLKGIPVHTHPEQNATARTATAEAGATVRRTS